MTTRATIVHSISRPKGDGGVSTTSRMAGRNSVSEAFSFLVAFSRQNL
jgi:hypothetical protein